MYRDSQLLAVSKPCGQPVQTKKKGVATVVSEWNRVLGDTVDSRDPYQAVHRIDQPVSGLVLLAPRSQSARLFSLFQSGSITREYIAVVDATPDRSEGEMVDTINENLAGNRSSVSTVGKQARLLYRTVGSTDHHTVLVVSILTGRHHQIRAQFSARGIHVVGDTKYGARRPLRDKGIALHAWRLTIPVEFSSLPLRLTAPFPQSSLWRAVAALDLPESSLDRVGDRM